MTLLKKAKPPYQVHANVFDQKTKPIVVRLGLTTIDIRQKGRRHGFEVAYEDLYRFAARCTADKARRDKIEKRKAQKGGKR